MSIASSRQNQNHIKSLDGLRGYAALAVCIYHGSEIFGFKKLIPHAYLAVDLFFVLSGFVLYYRYRAEILSPNAPLVLWDYLSQRIARLYPLYLFATLIGIAFYWYMFVDYGNFEPNFARLFDMADDSIFMIPYFEHNIANPNHKIFPYAYQAWSIFWEVILSLCFYFTLKWGRALEFAIMCVGIIGVYATTVGTHNIDEGWRNIHFEVGFFRAFGAFYCGVLISRAYQLLAQFRSKWLSIICTLIELFLIVLVVNYLHFHRRTDWALEMSLIYIGFPLLILSSALSFFSILNFGIFQFLGKISYSVYLLHGTATLIALWLIANRDWFEASIFTGCVWLGLVIGISLLSYHLIEMPLRIKLRRLLSKFGKMVSAKLQSGEK